MFSSADTIGHDTDRPLDWFDTTPVVTIFPSGLCLGVSLPITSKIPLTCAPSASPAQRRMPCIAPSGVHTRDLEDSHDP